MKYQYEVLGDEYEFQDFLIDLFNCLHHTTSFEEYRSKGYAQYGVDLYSPALKIAIQAKKKNISRSEPVLIHELTDDLNDTVKKIKDFPYPIDQLIFATTTKKYAAVQDLAIRLSQTGQVPVRFQSWEDIQKDIPHCNTVRNKYYRHLTRSSLPKELIIIPHIDQESLVGRDTDLSRLEAILSSKRIVCIQSIGGVGKTTFAKLYYQKRAAHYDSLIWLDYISDFKKDVALNLSLSQNLNIDLKQTDSIENRYQAILNSLVSLEGKVLVVIDNLEHESGLSVEQEIRKLLSHQNLYLLITSRHRFPSFPSYVLSPVEVAYAKKIFRTHCTKRVDDTTLGDLLELIDCNALMTELIAKTISNSVGLTLETVISRLVKSDIEDEELNVEIEQYTKDGLVREKLHQQISLIFDLNTLNGDYEWYLVLLLSVLPSVFLPIEELFTFFLYSEKNRSAVLNTINRLHQRGLITRSDDEVKMHQLIQDVVRMQASSYSIYLLVLNSIIRSLDKANATFSDSGYQLQQYAQSVLDKMIGTKAESVWQPLTLLKNNLFLAYRYLGAPQKAKVLANQLIDDLPKLESLRVDDRFFLSTLHHNIASYYMDEHNLEEAEKYFKKAIEVLDGKFFIKSVQFYNGLFVIYYRQNRYKEALECCSKALAIVKDLQAGENDHLLAMITNNFATINLKLGELPQAAQYVTAAIKIHRESNSEEKNDAALAHYYSNAALTFSLLGNHELAIQFALHAIEYRGRLNLENDYELLTHYRLAADVYEKAGEREKALQLKEVIQKAKQSFDQDENNSSDLQDDG